MDFDGVSCKKFLKPFWFQGYAICHILSKISAQNQWLIFPMGICVLSKSDIVRAPVTLLLDEQFSFSWMLFIVMLSLFCMSNSGIHHLTGKCDTLTYTLKGDFSCFFPSNMTQKMGPWACYGHFCFLYWQGCFWGVTCKGFETCHILHSHRSGSKVKGHTMIFHQNML